MRKSLRILGLTLVLAVSIFAYPGCKKDVVVTPSTVPLDSITESRLLSVSGDTYYFDQAASKISALKPGDIIVGTKDGGYARRIVSISNPAVSLFSRPNRWP